MPRRSPINPERRSVRSRIVPPIVSLLLLASHDVKAQQADPGKQGLATSAEATTVHPLLHLPLVYVHQGGSELDGYHLQSFGPQRIAFWPKLSDSLGIRPSAGVLVKNLLSKLSVSAALSLEYTKHRAISYNVNNFWYEHETAALYNLGVELRIYAELGHFKPFMGVTPGYGWLQMPKGITVTSVDPVSSYPYNTSWSDITLRGTSFEACAGLVYEIIPVISADASIGYRLQGFSSSTQGSLNGWGYSPALLGSLGVLIKI